MKGWKYKSYPTSWCMVGHSSDVAPGQTVPIEFCGEDLVLYRTESGQVNAFDAYCAHLVAHLGHGGCVQGENLQCPWHGWKWSLQARNVDIPFSDPPTHTPHPP